MPKYYVNSNAQSNGDHEVHVETCSHLPSVLNRVDQGFHQNCSTAVQAAKKFYTKSNGAITAAMLATLANPLSLTIMPITPFIGI
ncbi:hypothetical protein [Aeromonas veronii]|uniref:hypothetical protein n=1 Tax=Aeromonas veronii TaxID=654 RepID=UPI003D25473C